LISNSIVNLKMKLAFIALFALQALADTNSD
jgi:hypothetical protein